MAKHGGAEALLVVILCVAAIFIDCAASRHVGGSCPGCHGDKRLDENLSALSKFWKKVQAAMTDTEKQLDMSHDKGRKTVQDSASVVNDVIRSPPSRFADKRANRQPVANGAPCLSEGLVSNLTARVEALEQTMVKAVSEGKQLESEINGLRYNTKDEKEPPLPRHLRSYVEHLEENVGTIERKLGEERAKIRRYEEELALVIGKQASLEKMLEHLESLIAFRSLVPQGDDPRRSRSHDAVRPASGHRDAVSQGAVREKKANLEDDSFDEGDFYDYNYDYDYTHEARGQR